MIGTVDNMTIDGITSDTSVEVGLVTNPQESTLQIEEAAER